MCGWVGVHRRPACGRAGVCVCVCVSACVRTRLGAGGQPPRRGRGGARRSGILVDVSVLLNFIIGNKCSSCYVRLTSLGCYTLKLNSQLMCT